MAKEQPIEITEVSFGYTANLGNYESARVDLKARVNKGQDWQAVLEELRAQVAGEVATDKAAAENRRGQATPSPFPVPDLTEAAEVAAQPQRRRRR